MYERGVRRDVVVVVATLFVVVVVGFVVTVVVCVIPVVDVFLRSVSQ